MVEDVFQQLMVQAVVIDSSTLVGVYQHHMLIWGRSWTGLALLFVVNVTVASD